MSKRKPRSAEHRAKSVASIDAINADPEILARRTRRRWTPERRELQRALMRAMNADPAFQKKRDASGNIGRPDGSASIPRHAHPVVRGLFFRMRKERASYERVFAPAGLSIGTLSAWRRCSMPLIDTIDAALNVLGLQLAIVPLGTRDDYGFYKTRGRPNDYEAI